MTGQHSNGAGRGLVSPNCSNWTFARYQFSAAGHLSSGHENTTGTSSLERTTSHVVVQEFYHPTTMLGRSKSAEAGVWTLIYL